ELCSWQELCSQRSFARGQIRCRWRAWGPRRLEPLGQSLERRVERWMGRMGRMVGRIGVLAFLLLRPPRLRALARRLLLAGLVWPILRMGCHILARSLLRLRPALLRCLRQLWILRRLRTHAPRQNALRRSRNDRLDTQRQ